MYHWDVILHAAVNFDGGLLRDVKKSRDGVATCLGYLFAVFKQLEFELASLKQNPF